MKLEFKPEDFNDFKSFEESMKRQVESDCYVGSNSMVIWYECPESLSHRHYGSGKEHDKMVKKSFGPTASYVNGHVSFYYEYPKGLVEMLRPFPPKLKYEFDVESLVV
jgi:hypothetical protein